MYRKTVFVPVTDNIRVPCTVTGSVCGYVHRCGFRFPGTGHGFPADLGAYVSQITEFLLRAGG